MIDFHYNHNSSLIEAHSAQRKIALNERRSELFRQLKVQILLKNVLSSLRVKDSITIETILNVRRNDQDEIFLINSLFIARDIYNFRADLRQTALRSLTFIQTLIKKLDEDDN